MIKLINNFDVELSDLLDMDNRFTYILDLFNINSYEELVNQREEVLETYLLDSSSEKEFVKRKNWINRYFETSSFTKRFKKLMESKFDD